MRVGVGVPLAGGTVPCTPVPHQREKQQSWIWGAMGARHPFIPHQQICGATKPHLKSDVLILLIGNMAIKAL